MRLFDPRDDCFTAIFKIIFDRKKIIYLRPLTFKFNMKYLMGFIIHSFSAFI